MPPRLPKKKPGVRSTKTRRKQRYERDRAGKAPGHAIHASNGDDQGGGLEIADGQEDGQEQGGESATGGAALLADGEACIIDSGIHSRPESGAVSVQHDSPSVPPPISRAIRMSTENEWRLAWHSPDAVQLYTAREPNAAVKTIKTQLAEAHQTAALEFSRLTLESRLLLVAIIRSAARTHRALIARMTPESHGFFPDVLRDYRALAAVAHVATEGTPKELEAELWNIVMGMIQDDWVTWVPGTWEEGRAGVILTPGHVAGKTVKDVKAYVRREGGILGVLLESLD